MHFEAAIALCGSIIFQRKTAPIFMGAAKLMLPLKGNLFLTCKYIITCPEGYFITKVLQTHQTLIKFC